MTIGVFGIINTEMGVLGILPLLAEKFSISIAQAGLLVSLFALAVAAAGPVMPLLFAGIDRKRVMLLVLSVCGAIGVRRISSASGDTIGPPADRLYPVEPVGVEMMIPSAL